MRVDLCRYWTHIVRKYFIVFTVIFNCQINGRTKKRKSFAGAKNRWSFDRETFCSFFGISQKWKKWPSLERRPKRTQQSTAWNGKKLSKSLLKIRREEYWSRRNAHEDRFRSRMQCGTLVIIRRSSRTQMWETTKPATISRLSSSSTSSSIVQDRLFNEMEQIIFDSSCGCGGLVIPLPP